MTRGLVTGAIVVALAAVFALPVFADELGAPPAGEALPTAAPPAAEAPPAPSGPPAEGAPVPSTPSAPSGAAPRAGLPSPPPPPPPPPGQVQGAPADGAGSTAGTVPLGARYAPDPVRDAALEREACAATPCMPQGRIVRGWGGDPMTIQDPTQYYGNAFWGTSLSVLPNLGVTFAIGGVYSRTNSLIWAWEAELTYQFLDDEFFADDGAPAAGDWWQVQLGVKILSHPLSRRHWTVRWGGVWFYAQGEPNIVEESGSYFGAYAGVGFETDLSCSFSMGPELSGMFVVHQDGRFEVVPQFNWHFIWKF